MLAPSVSKALLEAFPNIGLEKSKFAWTKCTSLSPRLSFFIILSLSLILFYIVSWHTTESRRIFFERYAEQQGFDPLNPDYWYSQSRDKILAVKVQDLLYLPLLPLSLPSFYSQGINLLFLSLF